MFIRVHSIESGRPSLINIDNIKHVGSAINEWNDDEVIGGIIYFYDRLDGIEVGDPDYLACKETVEEIEQLIQQA